MLEKMLTGYPSVDKPWRKYYSEEAINTPLPECTIFEYLWDNNKNYPNDIAINYLGRKITYKTLFENIDKTAAAFLNAGVKEKEIVTVALPSIPEALYCVYALNKIGAVANMIHPLAGQSDAIYYFNEVQSRVAVIFDGAYGDIAGGIDKTSIEAVIVASPADSLPVAMKTAYLFKHKKPVLDGRVFKSWKSFIKEGKGTTVFATKKNCHEMAIISHTGGTTGEPKGVMCSDYSILAEIWQLVIDYPHSRQERYLPVIPPFHNYSLVNSMMVPLSCGFVVILLPKYEPEKFAEYVAQYGPNHIMSIPTYWEALLKIKELEKMDLSCLNHIFYGGEMMTPEMEEEVSNLLLSRGAKNPLYKGLGSTEMTSAATMTYESCNMPGSVGIPLARVNCKIVEPGTTNELSYGQEGEICFSGPTMMIGYYKHPKATNDIVKIHPDGERWLHTGDLGYLNEDGVLFVSGRIKRILITRDCNGHGTKMFPDRIEKVIYSHPNVQLCCVIGIPDEIRVNYPKAFVVLKNESLNAKNEIMNLCEKKLPEYMVPVEIAILDDLPRTAAGKIDYRALEIMTKKN